MITLSFLLVAVINPVRTVLPWQDHAFRHLFGQSGMKEIEEFSDLMLVRGMKLSVVL